MKLLSYALISPAHNEERYIETTIKSVISQTLLPCKWIVVNDGSTDNTGTIIQRYTKHYPWIIQVDLPVHRDRQFAAKANAFNAGLNYLKKDKYDILGNLDSDLSFEPDYFEYLIGQFSEYPTLGVAGTPFVEKGFHSFNDSGKNINHVSGACQLFRKECFEEIGGYTPNKAGGIDWIAVTTARMMGWITRTFPEKVTHHHRKMGTSSANSLIARFKHGKKDYYLGNHPVWEITRFIFQMSKKPYIFSGLFLLSGYTWGYITRQKRPVSEKLMSFHRAEQMKRLGSIFRKPEPIPGLNLLFTKDSNTMKKKLFEHIQRLDEWVINHKYKAYEPFDGNSSFLHIFTFNNIFLERILQQLVLRTRFNIRPFIGIFPQESTKGRGYMAWGYLTLYKITKQKEFKEKAEVCLEWLDKNKSQRYDNHSWGNHFPFSSRAGKLPKHEPIIVWTSLIGQAYLDAYELFKEEKYLTIAKSICRWILALPREQTDSGVCLSYVAFKQRTIHNSNMLGGAMLARTAYFTKDADMMSVAKEAMEYSCTRQLANGAWYYGEALKYHWIDNFHTGYNLDSLKTYITYSSDTEYSEVLKKGFDYFKNTFFKHDGKPKYFDNSTYPIDSQCASQAIETLTLFSDDDDDALDLAIKVANWTIDNMYDYEKGYFYYRIYPNSKNKTPMLHWAQATMFKALATLYAKL